MSNFADRLSQAVLEKGNPVVVGLDPRFDMIPDFVKGPQERPDQEAAAASIVSFHKLILDLIGHLVPAVKLQIAFYEQYGLPGLRAFQETIALARDRKLIVIADAKRNDIASTATAYANAFLGKTNVGDRFVPAFDVDCLTVTPYLGRDSLEPFVDVCVREGKGLFVLVRTSNPGSRDIQDEILQRTGAPLYELVAEMVADAGTRVIGKSGYSSIGAVVGATFPEQASRLRRLMPESIFLVPGYGAQGGTAEDAARCFNADGLGAVVNASRSITYPHKDCSVREKDFADLVLGQANTMIRDLSTAITKLA